LVILLISAPVISGLTWYGLSNKPIVDYTFGGAGDVRLYYRLNASTPQRPGTIDIAHVLVRNTGHTNLSIIVTLHAVNAVVSADYYGPYNEMANEEISVSANSGYRVVTFHLTLMTQVSSFAIWCEVNKVVDYSTFSSSVATSFSEIDPTLPTHLQYAQGATNPYGYQLAQPP
jgi:hypothetical protein